MKTLYQALYWTINLSICVTAAVKFNIPQDGLNS